MEYPNSFSHPMPPESQSRQLDMSVQAQEMPYGYMSPPPAYDAHMPPPKESTKRYMVK